ncbi:hypothetical protein JG688_00011405, partial [Phytophthora aleatoria]
QNDHQNNGILRDYFQLKRSKRSLTGGGATVSWSTCRPSYKFCARPPVKWPCSCQRALNTLTGITNRTVSTSISCRAVCIYTNGCCLSDSIPRPHSCASS